VHHLADKHGRASAQSSVRLLVLVLQDFKGDSIYYGCGICHAMAIAATHIIVVAVEVVTLTLHAPTALGHLAGDAPLLGQVLVDLLARLVAHHLRRYGEAGMTSWPSVGYI